MALDVAQGLLNDAEQRDTNVHVEAGVVQPAFILGADRRALLEFTHQLVDGGRQAESVQQ
ncbi:hypothetical protein D3C84_1117500 [compost metagenome]